MIYGHKSGKTGNTGGGTATENTSPAARLNG
jgi:hypothetical protein